MGQPTMCAHHLCVCGQGLIIALRTTAGCFHFPEVFSLSLPESGMLSPRHDEFVCLFVLYENRVNMRDLRRPNEEADARLSAPRI